MGTKWRMGGEEGERGEGRGERGEGRGERGEEGRKELEAEGVGKKYLIRGITSEVAQTRLHGADTLVDDRLDGGGILVGHDCDLFFCFCFCFFSFS